MQRVAKLLQREIAAILARELPQELMLTVTGARVTKDLSITYVYVSVMGATAEKRQAALANLQGKVPRIREALAQRIRHQLRRVPEIQFFLDESFQNASKMESLFETIREERAQRMEP